ncbi:hypothetical protein CAL7716_072320 [Calothrix sp. PCC 7716]|nr:hypothetical protein CAL7716_072320 [Calothrix sp. PCC 7716]
MARLKLSPKNWRLIKNVNRLARQFPSGAQWVPIPPDIFKISVPLCIVLISAPEAKYNWWFAGWVKAYLYSGAFVSRQLIGIKDWRLGIDRAEIIDFRFYEANQYALEISFPKWHRKIKYQVWEYTGTLTDATDTDIQRVLAQLASIEKKVNDISEFGRS